MQSFVLWDVPSNCPSVPRGRGFRAKRALMCTNTQTGPTFPSHLTAREMETRLVQLRNKSQQGISSRCSLVLTVPFVTVSHRSWGERRPVKQAHSSSQPRCHLPNGLMIKSKDGGKNLPKIVPRRNVSQGRLGSQHGPPCWPCRRLTAWRACSDRVVCSRAVTSLFSTTEAWSGRAAESPSVNP